LKIADQIYIIQDNPVKISQVEHIVDDHSSRDIFSSKYLKIREKITKILSD